MPMDVKVRGGLALDRSLGLKEMAQERYQNAVRRVHVEMSRLCEEIRGALLSIAENSEDEDLSVEMRHDIVNLAQRVYISGVEDVSGGSHSQGRGQVVHIGFHNEESLHLKIPYRDVMRLLEFGGMGTGQHSVWRPYVRKFVREVFPTL